MPIWEFTCPAGHVHELVDIARQFEDITGSPCPQCGYLATRTIFSVTHWQHGHGPQPSEQAKAIQRVQALDRTGR